MIPENFNQIISGKPASAMFKTYKYYYVYVLRSRIDKKFYTGFTTNLTRRISEHNSGRTFSTRLRTPFDIIYWEGCLDQKDATTREKYLKTAWGKRYLKNRMKNFLTIKGILD